MSETTMISKDSKKVLKGIAATIVGGVLVFIINQLVTWGLNLTGEVNKLDKRLIAMQSGVSSSADSIDSIVTLIQAHDRFRNDARVRLAVLELLKDYRLKGHKVVRVADDDLEEDGADADSVSEEKSPAKPEAKPKPKDKVWPWEGLLSGDTMDSAKLTAVELELKLAQEKINKLKKESTKKDLDRNMQEQKALNHIKNRMEQRSKK